jgi:hypothetical protein
MCPQAPLPRTLRARRARRIARRRAPDAQCLSADDLLSNTVGGGKPKMRWCAGCACRQGGKQSRASGCSLAPAQLRCSAAPLPACWLAACCSQRAAR